jgi:hypothetical protein
LQPVFLNNTKVCMGPTEAYLRAESWSVLREAEDHLARCPMGEKYFCKEAGAAPEALNTIRSGKLVKAATIDKLRSFMLQRERQTQPDGSDA